MYDGGMFDVERDRPHNSGFLVACFIGKPRVAARLHYTPALWGAEAWNESNVLTNQTTACHPPLSACYQDWDRCERA